MAVYTGKETTMGYIKGLFIMVRRRSRRLRVFWTTRSPTFALPAPTALFHVFDQHAHPAVPGKWARKALHVRKVVAPSSPDKPRQFIAGHGRRHAADSQGDSHWACALHGLRLRFSSGEWHCWNRS